MAFASDPSFVVLHCVRLKGFAESAAVANSTGLPAAEVDAHLQSLAADGYAVHREGRLSGWALTGPGRLRHADLVADEVHRCGCRDAVDDAYRRFLAVNQRLLGVCTDWQIRREGTAQSPNDHSDPAYDAAVLARLREIDAEVQPVCADLASAMERFARYGPRLAAALDRLEAGDLDWLTKPIIASYHTVWFELHEDLLATLGIERSSEADVPV